VRVLVSFVCLNTQRQGIGSPQVCVCVVFVGVCVGLFCACEHREAVGSGWVRCRCVFMWVSLVCVLVFCACMMCVLVLSECGVCVGLVSLVRV